MTKNRPLRGFLGGFAAKTVTLVAIAAMASEVQADEVCLNLMNNLPPPTVARALIVLGCDVDVGVMQQVVRAFGRVESSFQYLVLSWTTIIELISIYKRLRAFEATLRYEPLAEIEREVTPVPASDL